MQAFASWWGDRWPLTGDLLAATCDSGYPPDGLTSLGGSVCVGVGRGSGGRSGRPGCRWIGAPCSCRWRSSGRGDIWVVGALGGGLCS